MNAKPSEAADGRGNPGEAADGPASQEATLSVETVVDAARDMYENHRSTFVVTSLAAVAVTALLLGYALSVSPIGTAVAATWWACLSILLYRAGSTFTVGMRSLQGAAMLIVFVPTAGRVATWEGAAAPLGAAVLLVPPAAFSVWAVKSVQPEPETA